MKRDMELIKKILLAVEEKNTFYEPFSSSEFGIQGYEDAELVYHLKLAHEAGLIEIMGNKPVQTMGATPQYFVKSLTWEGHEFLEASKNPTVWNKVIKTMQDKGVGMGFDILKGLLLQETIHLVGLK
jgi:hypothetical protein